MSATSPHFINNRTRPDENGSLMRKKFRGTVAARTIQSRLYPNRESRQARRSPISLHSAYIHTGRFDDLFVHQAAVFQFDNPVGARIVNFRFMHRLAQPSDLHRLFDRPRAIVVERRLMGVFEFRPFAQTFFTGDALSGPINQAPRCSGRKNLEMRAVVDSLRRWVQSNRFR